MLPYATGPPYVDGGTKGQTQGDVRKYATNAEKPYSPTFRFLRAGNGLWVFDEYHHEIISAASWEEVD
jgi:hypothetical protein